jgi:hypothetical protein
MQAKRDYLDRVHSDQMILGIVQRERLDQRWPKATPGGPSGSSPLRSDGSCDGQVGRLDCLSGGQKTLKGN